MSDVSQVLNRAADLIETEGWCQGKLTNPKRKHTQYCVMGAIGQACDDLELKSRLPSRRAIKDYLAIESLVCWNDAPDRTQAEVVAALRAAAKEAS